MMRVLVLVMLTAIALPPDPVHAREVILGTVQVQETLRVDGGVSAVVLVTPPPRQDGEELVEVMLVGPADCAGLEGEAVPVPGSAEARDTRASLDAPGTERLVLGCLTPSDRGAGTLSFHLNGLIGRLGSEPLALGIYLTGCDAEVLEAVLASLNLEVRQRERRIRPE